MPMTRLPRLHVASEIINGKQHCRLCFALLLDIETTDGYCFEAGAMVRETREHGESLLCRVQSVGNIPPCQRVTCSPMEASLYT